MRHLVCSRAFLPFAVPIALTLCFGTETRALPETSSTNGFSIRFTGTNHGRGTGNLKLEVKKTMRAAREMPCHSLWFLLLEGSTGSRRLVVGLVKRDGVRGGRLMVEGWGRNRYTEMDFRAEVAGVSKSATEIDGKELARFTITPWPAMCEHHGSDGAGGPWGDYALFAPKPRMGNFSVAAWRVEVWQNGVVVATYSEPSPASFQRNEIPAEWWVLGKNPTAITY